MLNVKSLIAVAAIATFATTSMAQAAGRKTVHHPQPVISETVRASHAELRAGVPAAVDFGTRGLSAPAGRS